MDLEVHLLSSHHYVLIGDTVQRLVYYDYVHNFHDHDLDRILERGPRGHGAKEHYDSFNIDIAWHLLWNCLHDANVVLDIEV